MSDPIHPAWEKAADAIRNQGTPSVKMPAPETFDEWCNETAQVMSDAIARFATTSDAREGSIEQANTRAYSYAAKAVVENMLDRVVDEVKLIANEQAGPVSLEGFVPKYYVMDPETEDLLFDGNDLRKGMVVLIARNNLRENLSETMNASAMDKARRWNRWVTVDSVPILSRGSTPQERYIQFIGLYEDGTKQKLDVTVEHAWYVKKDSLPYELEIPSGYVEISKDGTVRRMTFDEFLKEYELVRVEPQEAVKPSDSEYEQGADPEPENNTRRRLSAAMTLGGPNDDGSTPPWVDDVEMNFGDPNLIVQTNSRPMDPDWVEDLERKWIAEKGTSTLL